MENDIKTTKYAQTDFGFNSIDSLKKTEIMKKSQLPQENLNPSIS